MGVPLLNQTVDKAALIESLERHLGEHYTQSYNPIDMTIELMPRSDLMIETIEHPNSHTINFMSSLFHGNSDEPLQDTLDASFSYPQPEHSVPPPDESENEKKITEISYARDNIPDEFLCAISSQVMSDPVYAPGVEHVKFERAQIEHWLKTKPKHPHTGQSLTADNLQADSDLKERINKFVADATESDEACTSCRPG